MDKREGCRITPTEKCFSDPVNFLPKASQAARLRWVQRFFTSVTHGDSQILSVMLLPLYERGSERFHDNTVFCPRPAGGAIITHMQTQTLLKRNYCYPTDAL